MIKENWGFIGAKIGPQLEDFSSTNTDVEDFPVPQRKLYKYQDKVQDRNTLFIQQSDEYLDSTVSLSILCLNNVIQFFISFNRALHFAENCP